GAAAAVGVLQRERRRTVRRSAIAPRQTGIAQNRAQNRGHVFVSTHERRVVRQTETEDFAHVRVLLACKGIRRSAVRGSATLSMAPSGRALAGARAAPVRGRSSRERPPPARRATDGRTRAAGTSDPGTRRTAGARRASAERS